MLTVPRRPGNAGTTLPLTLPYGAPIFQGVRGRLAQLARAPARHAGGHRFKSCSAHFEGHGRLLPGACCYVPFVFWKKPDECLPCRTAARSLVTRGRRRRCLGLTGLTCRPPGRLLNRHQLAVLVG